MSDTGDISDVSEDPQQQRTEVDDLAEDPVTGSTPKPPDSGDSGLPPAGDDPMAGEAPSS
jgi:hypothetical protein